MTGVKIQFWELTVLPWLKDFYSIHFPKWIWNCQNSQTFALFFWSFLTVFLLILVYFKPQIVNSFQKIWIWFILTNRFQPTKYPNSLFCRSIVLGLPLDCYCPFSTDGKIIEGVNKRLPNWELGRIKLRGVGRQRASTLNEQGWGWIESFSKVVMTFLQRCQLTLICLWCPQK